MTGYPKPEPGARDRRKELVRNKDTNGTRAARRRCLDNGGMCEATFVGGGRCGRRATECHHLAGRHNVDGYWQTAEAKQILCGGPNGCHAAATRQIGGVKIRLVQAGPLPRWDDPYERVR